MKLFSLIFACALFVGCDFNTSGSTPVADGKVHPDAGQGSSKIRINTVFLTGDLWNGSRTEMQEVDIVPGSFVKHVTKNSESFSAELSGQVNVAGKIITVPITGHIEGSVEDEPLPGSGFVKGGLYVTSAKVVDGMLITSSSKSNKVILNNGVLENGVFSGDAAPGSILNLNISTELLGPIRFFVEESGDRTVISPVTITSKDDFFFSEAEFTFKIRSGTTVQLSRNSYYGFCPDGLVPLGEVTSDEMKQVEYLLPIKKSDRIFKDCRPTESAELSAPYSVGKGASIVSIKKFELGNNIAMLSPDIQAVTFSNLNRFKFILSSPEVKFSTIHSSRSSFRGLREIQIAPQWIDVPYNWTDERPGSINPKPLTIKALAQGLVARSRIGDDLTMILQYSPEIRWERWDTPSTGINTAVGVPWGKLPYRLTGSAINCLVTMADHGGLFGDYDPNLSMYGLMFDGAYPKSADADAVNKYCSSNSASLVKLYHELNAKRDSSYR